MEQILSHEVNVGDRVMVVQNYRDAGSRYFMGQVLTAYDEYVTMDCAPEIMIDLHSNVKMDVSIKRV